MGPPILRRDFTEPLYSVATFDSYAPKREGKLTGNWVRMPDMMIAKCAESLALRRAFPQELSGLHTAEEMAQADDQPKDVTPPKEKPVQPADLLATVYYSLGIDPDMEIRNHLNQPRELVKGKPVSDLWA